MENIERIAYEIASAYVSTRPAARLKEVQLVVAATLHTEVTTHTFGHLPPPGRKKRAVPKVLPPPSDLVAQDLKKLDPRESVFDTHLICLDCGNKFSKLRRHVREAHGLSVEEYLLKHGLPSHYPLVSPLHSRTMTKALRARHGG